jgi:hypothetical protein
LQFRYRGSRRESAVAQLFSLGIMERHAHIQLKAQSEEVCLRWAGFDGDDSFTDFHISVTRGGDTRHFDFGPCAVFGLRKMRRFFTEATQQTAGLGFRHPDIRLCDVFRSDDSYKFVVQFEGSGLREEFQIHKPKIEVSDA